MMENKLVYVIKLRHRASLLSYLKLLLPVLEMFNEIADELGEDE